jgi:RhoGEF domain
MEESPLTPVTESTAFPLSSKTFARCKEIWSLSSLRNWIQDVFGPNVTMETVSLALQGLFTHYVSTLSIQTADKLATQVGTTWLREGVLFEPTVANTALWNPLSTLEFSLTPVELEGVLPKLTGKGCYSPRCSTTPPGVGRCYSHHCSRTLVKKSQVSTALPTPTGPASDWISFWNIDAEFTRSMEKREIKRQNVIFEFIQTEEEYVSDLNTMLNAQKQLISASSTQTPIIPPSRLDSFLKTVFGQVKPILDWQTKKLLIPLRERQAQQGPVVRGVGDIVLEWVRGCSNIYADYSGGYPSANQLVREESATNPFFVQWLDVFFFFKRGLMIAITIGSCLSTIGF